MNPTSSNRTALIKTIYFYVVALIGLMMVVFSTADLVNLGLKTWVFPKADLNEWKEPSCAVMTVKDPSFQETEAMFQQRLRSCEESRVNEDEARIIRNQKSAVRDISFIVVGLPLFLYHWTTIRKESRNGREEKA